MFGEDKSRTSGFVWVMSFRVKGFASDGSEVIDKRNIEVVGIFFVLSYIIL